jgi:hypothetical protein
MSRFAIIVLLLIRSQSWDTDGHKNVAKKASELISRKAARFIYTHLKGAEPIEKRGNITRLERSLVSVSAWADYIYRAEESYAWSGELHFSNTPYPACGPFDFRRDCGAGNTGRCVVSAIANYTDRASDFTASQDERGEALKFVVHLIADIHNPMHVGFSADQGGNGILVGLANSHGRKESLHEIWDSVLIDSLKSDHSPDAQWWDLTMARSKNWKKQVWNRYTSISLTDNVLSFAGEIASETAQTVTCPFAYRLDSGDLIDSGSVLPESYIDTRKSVAWAQLEKSAIRLAQILEFIAKSYYRQEAEAMMALSSRRSPSGMEARNPFSDLDTNETFEDYVFEREDPLEVVSDDVPEVPEETATLTSEAGLDIRVLSPEEKKRLENKKRALRRSHNKPTLIKRNSKYYIVRRGDVESDEWVPIDYVGVRVPLIDGAETLIGFDSRLPEVLDPRFNIEVASRLIAQVVGKAEPVVGEKAVDHEAMVSKSFISSAIEKSRTLYPYSRINFRTVPFDDSKSFKVPSNKELNRRYPLAVRDANQSLTERYLLEVLQADVEDLFISLIPRSDSILVSRKSILVEDFKNLLRGTVGLFFNTIRCNNMSLIIDTRVFDVRPTAEIHNFLQVASHNMAVRRNVKIIAETKHPLLLAMREVVYFFDNDGDVSPITMKENCPNLVSVNAVEREVPVDGAIKTFQIVLSRA